jgi:flavorubredoxin
MLLARAMAISDRNDVLMEIFWAKAVLVGSPTLNNGLLPSIMPIQEDIRGLKFQNKIGAAFGCYGWNGESPKIITEHLERLSVNVIAEPIRAKWQPEPVDLDECRQFGAKIPDGSRQE